MATSLRCSNSIRKNTPHKAVCETALQDADATDVDLNLISASFLRLRLGLCSRVAQVGQIEADDG